MSIENLTISELLTKYEEDKQILETIDDFNNPTEEQALAMTDISDARKFFTQTQESIDYIAACAVLHQDGSVDSLMNKNSYLSTLLDVTDVNNKDFLDKVYSESTNKKTVEDKQRVEESINTVICGNPMLTQEFLSMADQMPETTVEDTMRVNGTIHNMLEAEKISGKTTDIFDFVREQLKNEQSKNKPLQIVESNDGYVMAVSIPAEEIAANLDLSQEFASKVKNGNEVVHNEAPRHTTSDPSRVGGNVQLEEVDDLGTIERDSGLQTEEEKEEDEQQSKSNRNNYRDM
jgi:hypothetical protein